MPTPRFTNEIVNAAILGMEAQKEKLDAKIAELRAWLTGGPTEHAAAPEPATRKRRKMSAAGRKAIAEAQRKRWAASKKGTEPAPQEAPKPKRRISKEGLARIVAATKKRWEAVRAAKAQQERAAAKKPAKKSAPVRNSAAKKSATAAAQSITETGGQ